MADSSREAVAFVEESVWGTTPASALAQAAYVTGVSGGLERQTVRTSSLRSDYVRPSTILVSDQGGMSINYELAYGDVIPAVLFEGLFRRDWTSPASVTATDISFAEVDNSLNSVAQTLTVFPAGTWVRVEGSASNDGRYFVVTSATGKLVLHASTPVTDEAATESITVDNDGYLRNGSASPVVKSYTGERNFASQSSTPFRTSKGLRVASATLDVGPGIVTGSLGMVGLPPIADAAATAGSGAYTAAVTTEPFSGANNFSTLVENSTSFAGHVNQITLNFGAGARAQMELGATVPWGIGSNAFDHSGTISVYKDDSSDSAYARVISFAPTFISFALADAAGNVLVFTMPRCKYTGGVADNSGNDSDIYQTLPFAIDRDPTYGYLVQIDRFAA